MKVCISFVGLSGQGHGTAPSPRKTYGLVEDGGRIIVFGGRSRSGDLNDVYSFDLLTLQWTFVIVSGIQPSKRASYGMAAERGLLFVFGGNIGMSMRCHSV